VILYRSAEPVLTPVLPEERYGTIANVVFPTGIDRRDDLGSPGHLGRPITGWLTTGLAWARLDVPDFVPTGRVADPAWSQRCKHPISEIKTVNEKFPTAPVLPIFQRLFRPGLGGDNKNRRTVIVKPNADKPEA